MKLTPIAHSVLGSEPSELQNKQHRYNTTTSSQRARILAWFANTSPRLSTIDAREKLSIPSPAPRVLELRRAGHKINLEWTRQKDITGTYHRIGLYVYQGEEATR